MYADIPFSWDKLPADGGSIGWTNATDRNNGHAGLAGPLDGFSIMTFSKDSFAAVETATDYERSRKLRSRTYHILHIRRLPLEFPSGYAFTC